MYKIDFDSSIPLFEQIEQKTRLCIASGAFQEGMRIPSIRDIAKASSLNHQTVVKAYRNLFSEGLIAPLRGMGFVVAKGAKTKCQRYRTNYLKKNLEATLDDGALGGLSIDELKDVCNTAIEKVAKKYRSFDVKGEQKEWMEFQQDRRIIRLG